VYVWSVAGSRHSSSGGTLQSFRGAEQSPDRQVSGAVHWSPSSQVAPSANAYEHRPPEQVPARKQADGGFPQTTPAQGSPRHTPPAQPAGQWTTWNA